MKKIFLLLSLVSFILSEIHAQIKPDKIKDTGELKIKPNAQTPIRVIKTIPAETKTSQPPVQNSTTATQAASVYTLTSVKASLQTGNDNKEFPSVLRLVLFQRNTNIAVYGIGNSFKNELPVNSFTDFGLENAGYNSNKENLRLEKLQQTGLILEVFYTPNFLLDAWKIEGVTLTLEFKDQYGNLHPVYGSKKIVFNTARGILNNTYRLMRCHADETFTPLTSLISEK